MKAIPYLLLWSSFLEGRNPETTMKPLAKTSSRKVLTWQHELSTVTSGHEGFRPHGSSSSCGSSRRMNRAFEHLNIEPPVEAPVHKFVVLVLNILFPSYLKSHTTLNDRAVEFVLKVTEFEFFVFDEKFSASKTPPVGSKSIRSNTWTRRSPSDTNRLRW